MKLNKEQIHCITQTIKTAALVGVDGVQITSAGLHGMNDAQNVFLIHYDNIPAFDFTTMAVTDLSGFTNRLSLFDDPDALSIEATINDRHNCVSKIVMKSGRTKVEYQCTDPRLVPAPKNIADEFHYCFDLDDESVTKIQKAMGIFKSDTFTIKSNMNGVTFEIQSINNDTFEHTLPSTVGTIQGTSTDFIFQYPAKVALSLFKQTREGRVQVGKKGTLGMELNGINVQILQFKKRMNQ